MQSMVCLSHSYTAAMGLILPVSLQVAWVPGSFELPVVAKSMARSGKYDAIVAIGTVVSSRPSVD